MAQLQVELSEFAEERESLKKSVQNEATRMAEERRINVEVCCNLHLSHHKLYSIFTAICIIVISEENINENVAIDVQCTICTCIYRGRENGEKETERERIVKNFNTIFYTVRKATREEQVIIKTGHPDIKKIEIYRCIMKHKHT